MTTTTVDRPATLIELLDLIPVSEHDPVEVSPPTVFSDEQRNALETLPAVFGKVAPSERRSLESDEIAKLLVERDLITTIEDLVKRRKDDIRNAVLAHHDVRVEADLPADVRAALERTPEGHYVRAEQYGAEGQSKCFSVQTSSGKVSVNAPKLASLADDEDYAKIDHEAYLSCTTQTRVFDEAKAAIVLRERPELLEAFQDAAERSPSRVAVYVRKAQTPSR